MFPSRNATVLGSPGWVNERSISFDGTDSRVSVPDSDIFDHDDGTYSKFTLSYWVYSAWGGTYALTCKQTDADSGAGEREYYNHYASTNDNFYFQIKLLGSTAMSANYVENWADGTRWYHVVLVYDGSLGGTAGADRVAIYKDGVKQTVAKGSNTNPERMNTFTAPFGFGSLYSDANAHALLGRMDEIMWINRYSANQSDVTYLYNNGKTRDLTDFKSSYKRGYWRMGEGGESLPAVPDVIGGNDGTLVNGTATDYASPAP